VSHGVKSGSHKLSQVVSGALHTRTGRLNVCLVVKPCGVWPGRVAKA